MKLVKLGSNTNKLKYKKEDEMSRVCRTHGTEEKGRNVYIVFV